MTRKGFSLANSSAKLSGSVAATVRCDLTAPMASAIASR
jgi:hypothetical protein